MLISVNAQILVTARDLAIMAATLANNGVNPQTGERVVSPYVVARTLSVMTSSGMYDFAGEWMYRVGIPAKSGVGGGIIAALPSQLGLGTFSPRLDDFGNSVRGVLVCEELSKIFRPAFTKPKRRRSRQRRRGLQHRTHVVATHTPTAQEQKILDAHADDIRVLELAGALNFANMDYICRQLDLARAQPAFLVIDLGRVPTIAQAAATLLGELMADLTNCRVTTVGHEVAGEVAAVGHRHLETLARATETIRNRSLLERTF